MQTDRIGDILRRLEQLKADRLPWEYHWREIGDFFLPAQSRFMPGVTGSFATMDATLRLGPASRDPRGVRRRHDSTALWALDRLGAGMDGLCSPQSERWQDFTLDDLVGYEPTGEEKQWLDRYRNALFKIRYNPSSGFTAANPKAIRSACAFSVGIIYIEDGFTSDQKRPGQIPHLLYSHVPLSTAYLGTDFTGRYDTLFRVRSYTARQLAQRFGKEKLSKKVQEMLANPQQIDGPVGILHATFPRIDFDWDAPAGHIRNGAWDSAWIEIDNRHEIKRGGYFEFPYAILFWQQGEETAYGDSPCMLALDDARGLNIMKRAFNRGAQQFVDPPLGVNHEGMLNRPNLNPGSITPGAIDAAGNPKIRPIITGMDPSKGNSVLDLERKNIERLLYADLFQMLAQNPSETATAVLIKAEEKSNLLGPNGANISAGHVAMTERELGILQRQGIYAPDSALAPPSSLDGRKFVARSATPLDRLQRNKSLIAMGNVFTMAGQIEQVCQMPHVGDAFDPDAIIAEAVEITGAPAIMLLTAEKRDAARKAKADQAQQAQQLAAAKDAATAAKDGAAAGASIQETQANAAAAATPGVPQGMPGNDNGGMMPPGALGGGGAPGGIGSMLSAFGQ